MNQILGDNDDQNKFNTPKHSFLSQKSMKILVKSVEPIFFWKKLCNFYWMKLYCQAWVQVLGLSQISNKRPGPGGIILNTVQNSTNSNYLPSGATASY